MAAASPDNRPSSLAATSAAATASRSPSPSPSPSSSPGRSPSSLPLPESLPPPPPSSSRRLAAPIWTHDETLALIDAYRDKWYALSRGNLRASHWQEVADDVARRSSSGPFPPKTSVQCRHKMEKLRKRYRSERRKSLQLDPSRPAASSWVYFRKMDAMEHGNGRGAGGRRTSAPSSPAPPRAASDDDDEEEDDDRRGGPGGWGNTRGLHRLMANGGGAIGQLRFTIPKAVRSKVSRAEDRPAPSPIMNPSIPNPFLKGYRSGRPTMEEMQRKLEKKRRRRRRGMEMESSAVRAMVSALRLLGDGLLRMEQRKMEMVRELEKARMEMELKRTELILDSQRRIVDAVLKGYSRRKRAKVSLEN